MNCFTIIIIEQRAFLFTRLSMNLFKCRVARSDGPSPEGQKI